MNAPLASTELSSRSVCGTTAAAAHSFAASPFSLAAAGVPSLNAVFAAVREHRSSASGVSGVFSGTAGAATGRARYNTALALSPSATSNATETAAVQQQHHELEWQHREQHVEEQQLLTKVEALTVALGSPSTSAVVCNSSKRGGCSTTGRAGYFRERKCSISSINSSVGGETPPAAGRGKGIPAGGGECEGGSDCSTRSCASGRVLQVKEAANSSGDETKFRSTGGSRRPNVSTRITSEEGRNFVENVYWGNTSYSQEKQHCIFEGRSSINANSSGSFVNKLSEAKRNELKHLKRTSHSGGRDTRDHSTLQKNGVVHGKPQQQHQQHKSQRSSSPGAPLEEREVLLDETAASRISHRGHETELVECLPVRREEIPIVQEDVTFSRDESIIAPAFVTLRGGCRSAVVADASEPVATAAFRATSTVSATALALDQPEVATGCGAAAEKKCCAADAETEVMRETDHLASSSKIATWRGDCAAGVGGGSETSTNSSTPLFFSGKSSGSTRRGEGLKFAKFPFAPCYHSGEHHAELSWSTLGLPSAHLVASLPSATGASYHLTLGSIAAAAENPKGGFERTSWVEGCPEEEHEKEYGKAAEPAASTGEEVSRDTFATTAAGTARGVLAPSASNSRGGDLPCTAATDGLDVGAAAAATDSTCCHYAIDSYGVGVPLASVGSSVEWERVAALPEGKEAAAREGKDAAAREGKRGGVGLVVTSSGVCGGSRARSAAGGRRIKGEGAAALSGGGRDFQETDVNFQRRRGGAGTGGAGGSNTYRSSSSWGDCISEMAAGGERGCPGGMLLCAASGGGTKGGGGDVKTAGCVGTMRGNDFRYNNRNAGTVNMGRAATVMNRPTRVEAGRQKFLILDSPSDENLPAYIDEMKAFNVTHLVRTCEATYDDALVRQAGICTHEWIFPDGEPPPEEIIDEWLALCNSVATQQRAAAIAVHCVAGLGRAPVLVAVALIEKGMDPMDAIMFIRERRKGAINRRQLQFLKSYRRRSQMQRCCIKGCSIM